MAIAALNLSDSLCLELAHLMFYPVFHLPPPPSAPQPSPPREIRDVTDTTDHPTSDDEYLLAITLAQIRSLTTPKANVLIANVSLQVLIDSDASINVIEEKAYHAITKSPENKQLSLHPTSTKIYGYGSTTSLSVPGTFSTRVESKKKNNFRNYLRHSRREWLSFKL